MITGDYRILRARRQDLAGVLDRGAAERARPQPYFGAVINNGSMPTAAPAVVLTNPVILGGVEAEGQVPTYATVTAQVPVVVLGRVPATGEVLVAELVQGFWVARVGPPAASGAVTVCCSGVTIPAVLTLTDRRFVPDAITTLTYSPTGFVGPAWYGCSSPPIGGTFDCTTTPPTAIPGNVAVPRVYYFRCVVPPVLGQWRLGDIVPRCVGFPADLRGNPPVSCPADPTLSAAPFGSGDLNTPQAGTELNKTCSPTFRVGMYNLAPPLEKFVVQG